MTIVAVSALAVVAALGHARLGLPAPIAVVAGAGEGVFLPGSRAIVPALLGDDELQAGTALTSGAIQLATLVGPALGGALVAVTGPAAAFAVDAVTFLVSAAALARVRRAAVHAGGRDPGEVDGRSLAQIIRAERVIPVIFLLNVAANLGSGGVSEVALPALAHGPLHAGATGYGVLVASFGAGALVGVVIAGRARRSARPALVGSAAFLAQAGFEALVPFLGSTVPTAAAMLAYGALNGFANVLTVTAIQRWAPPALRGRIMGVLMLGSYGIYPVSVLLGGLIVHADGPVIVFPLGAGIIVLALLGALTQREWRDFGAEPSPA